MAAADRQPDAGLTPRAADAERTAGEAQVDAALEFADLPLNELLWSEPYRFEFFAALRVLARMQAAAGGDDEGADQFEGLRFRALASLSFPPSEIYSLTKPADREGPIEMVVAFFGLTGPQGALPRPYTELMIQRVQKRDYALRDFFDLFNNRLLHLFSAAGRKYRFYLTYERAAALEKRRRAMGLSKLRGFLLEERPRVDLFSQALLDLGSLGTPLLRYKDSVRTSPAPRIDITDDLLRHFSGHFAQIHRSAASLRQLLKGYFAIRVEIVQFAGRWVQLPPEYQTSLPLRAPLPAARGKPSRPAASGIASPKLGENTVVGSRVWEAQGRFMVRLGPLSFDQFRDYLPDGSAFSTMAHLVRLYVGGTLDFDIQPTLIGAEVPWCQLRASGPGAARLGWNTWVRNHPLERVVDDAVFRVSDQVSMGK
jgi:type VI secretion system protein ImpH